MKQYNVTGSTAQIKRLNLLRNGPLQDIYNIIFYTVKRTCKPNEGRYGKTKSKQLALRSGLWPLGGAFQYSKIPNIWLLVMPYNA